MKGIKVYIYGLLDESDQIIYVGKSSIPSYRLSYHKRDKNISVSRMKILDIFYDKENYWINKLIDEGHPLVNREVSSTVENYEIGDFIESTEKKRFKVRNIETGEIFSSAYKACNSYKKMSYEMFKYYLDGNVKTESRKYTEPFPFEII